MIITLKIKKTILILYIILTERKKEKKRQRKKWILTYPSIEEQRKATYIYICIHTILSITWGKREEYDGRGEISMTHGTTVCKNLFRYASV